MRKKIYVLTMVFALFGVFTAVAQCVPVLITPDNPWFEDFESYPHNAAVPLDTCWATPETLVVDNGTSPFVYTGYPYACHSGSNSLELKRSPVMVVFPEFANDIDKLTISFWGNTSAQNAWSAGTLTLGVITDINNPTSFIPVDTIPATAFGRTGQDAPYTNFMGEHSFAGVTPQPGMRIALRLTNTQRSWNLDDFTITAALELQADRLPYSATFGDDDPWWLNNADAANRWTVGVVEGSSDTALFITHDNSTPGYDIAVASTVMAERALVMPAADTVTDLVISGDTVLNGKILAQNIMIDGNVTLNGDSAILAETGEAADKVFGDVIIGKEDGSTFVAGSHDLTIGANDVTVFGLVDVGNASITADNNFSFTGSTMAAKKDLTITAKGDIVVENSTIDGNEIAAGNNLVLDGANVTVAGGLKAANGFTVTADETADIKATALDNGTINAATVVLDKKEDGESIAIGQDGVVVINADDVTIDNGTDVAVAFGKDAFATIGAENIAVKGATNLSLETTAESTLSVANVTGDMDVTADEALTVTDANVNGNFSVVAADLTVAGPVQAGTIDMTSDASIALEDAALVSTFGNTTLAATDAITVAGDNFVNVARNAVFNADVTGDGNLEVKASNVIFNGAVNADNLKAYADTLVVTDDIIASTDLDFSAIRQIILAGDAITLGGQTMYLNEIANAEEFATALTLDGNAVLNGDILAQSVTITGNTYLNNDITIVAATGSDVDKVFGNVVLGSLEGDEPTFVTGSHDLTVVGADVEAYGLVDVENFDVSANGRFFFQGSTMAAKKDMTINATGDIEINNSVIDGNEISAGDALVLNGQNVTVLGGLTAGNGFTVTGSENVEIHASTLDNGLINAGGVITLTAKEPSDADGQAAGNNDDPTHGNNNGNQNGNEGQTAGNNHHRTGPRRLRQRPDRHRHEGRRRRPERRPRRHGDVHRGQWRRRPHLHG